MAALFTLEKVRRTPVDPLFLSLVILLTGLGLSFLFSASYFHGERLFGNPYHFIARQTLLVGAGALLAWFITRMELGAFTKYIPHMLIAGLVLMVLTLVPVLSKPIYGARRWLDLGFVTFQPSELAKLILLFYLANFLAKREGQLGSTRDAVLPPLLVFGAFIVLSLAQNDYSAGLVMLLLGMVIMYLAGVKLWVFATMLVFGIPMALIFLFTKAYRVERLITFLNPFHDPSGMGYQLLAARRALTDGGFWGVGLGSGVRKLGSLPEVQSDFIFAVLAEEAGFIGVLILFLLFGLLFWRGLEISHKTQDKLNRYLGYGMILGIFSQFLVNVAVVSGTIPATGIPLPFFSAGGSSIVVTLMMCGILLNISRNGEKEAARG